MPVYVFKNPETEAVTELTMTMSEMSERTDNGCIELDGVVWKRCYSCEHGPSEISYPEYPIYSDSGGCHPNQVSEMRNFARERGVALNYTKDGRAIFESASHRRSALKVLGYVDRDGYD